MSEPATDPLGFTLNVEDDLVDPRDVPVADPEPKAKTPQEIEAENLELQNRIGRITAERDIALEAAKRPVTIEAPRAQPVDDGSVAARQRYDTFLESVGQKMLVEPKAATQELLQFVDYLVTDRIKSSTVPMATSTARSAVRNFISSMRDDDLYPRVHEQFTKTIEMALPGISQMPPDQQDQAIEAVYNIVVGQASRARVRNGRREEPPPYATGSTSSGQRPATVRKKMSEMQRQYVESAREAGISEERIKQVLDEMERD